VLGHDKVLVFKEKWPESAISTLPGCQKIMLPRQKFT
jgi:hypothetical protein